MKHPEVLRATPHLFVGLALLVSLAPAPALFAQSTGRFPSFAEDHAPPQGYQGRIFALSQDYPTAEPAAEGMPWDTIDFFERSGALRYARAVLAYGVEGNTEVDWVVQNNAVRTWFHAPWMHPGCGGREFVRGMTRERSSRPGELHPNQTQYRDNWAVGFYNPPGGYTVGRVWQDANNPNPAVAEFPRGTVGLKLLFTTATVEDAPFLDGSLEWTADVYPSTGANPCQRGSTPPARDTLTLRLLQIDIAVRDRRKDETTGWVFGTFIYDGAAEGASPFDRMQPVGLMWADDSGVTAEMHREGAFINDSLQDGFLNPDLIGRWEPENPRKVRLVHAGLGGRLNGPVDNPISSCMSCHGRAGSPSPPMVPSGVPTAAAYTEDDFRTFFAEVPHGPGTSVGANGESYQRLDYSLQLAVGIRNLLSSQAEMATTEMATVAVSAPETSRDPDETAPWEPVAPTEVPDEPGSRMFVLWAAGAALLLIVGLLVLRGRRARA